MASRHGSEGSETQDVRVLCGWCGYVVHDSADSNAPTSHGICSRCVRVLEGASDRDKSLPSGDHTLSTIEEHTNRLMCHLYQSRQMLLDVQRRVGHDGELLGLVGQVLASIRQQEREVANIQHSILSAQQRTA
jgi:hypothetical protein